MDRNLKILILTALSVVFIDQITKSIIVSSLLISQTIEVIPGFFDIVHVRNPGAAFGLFTGGGAARTVFLSALSVAALVIIWLMVRRTGDALAVFSLSLIAGGAVGNLIDRIRYGVVVDFLDFYIRGFHWPAFNAADSAITAGVALAAYAFYFRGEGGEGVGEGREGP